MILEEFALNPEAIKEWRDLNTITMNFGFHNGAVISLFPSSWVKNLQEKAQFELNGTVQHQWVIEKLKKIKDEILIKGGRDFDKKHDWIMNSIMQHEEKPFYKILHTEEVAGHTEVIRFELLDEILFKDLREGSIKRNATSFADVSELLLLNSKNIQFIDPYFSAKNKGFVKSLEAMLKKAGVFKRKNIASIQFHTSFKHSNMDVNIDEEKKILDSYYNKIIPFGQKIEFLWWDDDGIAEIHPRYLVTEKGGIRFDRGFVEPNIVDQQEAETDVLMMTLKMTASVSQKYREESSPYNVVDKHVLNGAG